MIEIRGDAFKLCFVHQRPFGARVNSIGSWQSAMELMGIVGVMVNCALIGIVYTIFFAKPINSSCSRNLKHFGNAFPMVEKMRAQF